MPYKASDLPRPHYIQVIHDELLTLVEQSNKEHNLNKLYGIHKRVDHLVDKKKKILKAMRKNYDKTTFERTFNDFYHVDK